MEFKNFIFQAWKAMHLNVVGLRKLWKIIGRHVHFCTGQKKNNLQNIYGQLNEQ